MSKMDRLNESSRDEKGETNGAETALDPARQHECKQEAVAERRAIAVAHGFHCSHKDAAAAAVQYSSRDIAEVGVRRHANTNSPQSTHTQATYTSVTQCVFITPYLAVDTRLSYSSNSSSSSSRLPSVLSHKEARLGERERVRQNITSHQISDISQDLPSHTQP